LGESLLAFGDLLSSVVNVAPTPLLPDWDAGLTHGQVLVLKNFRLQRSHGSTGRESVSTEQPAQIQACQRFGHGGTVQAAAGGAGGTDDAGLAGRGTERHVLEAGVPRRVPSERGR
jgi:hypothetical protein